ncbi:MAG: hypothetical protein JST40_00880 [Armatimonadetes bacterium]|nr:hypothetical protein [Armatimonadota bacterium]
MKDINACSGPWVGWSIQDGIRIGETMRLTIRNGQIEGAGEDMDGEFELIGSYHSKDDRVILTRRYSRTTEPSQEGVGIPYDYEGTWDGSFVSGNWHPRAAPNYGGPFEMWPASETDLEELQIDIQESATAKA